MFNPFFLFNRKQKPEILLETKAVATPDGDVFVKRACRLTTICDFPENVSKGEEVECDLK